jgi:paraquat-inducible protein B
MKQQVSKTLIGGFVVGAVALVFAGVMIFGSGKMFEKKSKFVLFFEGSVKGLNVGAPVLFRGVEVGSVTDILLIGDTEKMSLWIPVYIEIEQSKIRIVRGKRDPKTNFPRMIELGLRAQLQAQSLVTGQLMVELDLHPGTPLKPSGIKDKYTEIPTIPTTRENVAQTIKRLKLGELSHNISAAVAGFERLINSPNLSGSLSALHQTLDDARKLVSHVDTKIDPLTTNINTTLTDAQELLNNIDVQVEPLADSIRKTAAAATKAFKHAEQTLKAVEGVVGNDSPMMYQVNDTLRELSDAARSIRIWADYMDRHPEALLSGKK